MPYTNKSESTAFLITAYGYDYRITSHLVTDEELKNPEFIRDVRDFCYQQNIEAADWIHYICNEYVAYKGSIIDENGKEVLLNTSVFDIDENTLFNGTDEEVIAANLTIYNWIREFCRTPCSASVKPRVRAEAKERVRVLATILRASFPAEAFFWGPRGKAANDNNPPAT
ncbi:MAG: hypothetical protein R3D71_08325 [Rickettsiales bacterium]